MAENINTAIIERLEKVVESLDLDVACCTV